MLITMTLSHTHTHTPTTIYMMIRNRAKVCENMICGKKKAFGGLQEHNAYNILMPILII